ncbi:MAG: Na+/H+ antiporter NhaA [Lysobacterales bacterium]
MLKVASNKARETLQEFLKLESAGGILLAVAAALALVLANTPLAGAYQALLDIAVTVKVGGFGVDKALLLWINDGLMAIFFLLVGLELKREVVEGQLSSLAQLTMPAMAAIGGVAVPALIYVLISNGVPEAKGGWAIPTATDIAFALAVLTVMGSRVPISLKIFLATVAVIDDLMAIIIIAVFYTYDLSINAGLVALSGIAVLVALNRFGVTRIAAYMIVGTVIWLAVLKSGVHATLAGVVVAACIPLRADDDSSPARHLEHVLHPWVAFGVLPVFAFANAGLPLLDLGAEAFTNAITVGIAAGLFFGKQIGVFGMTALALVTGLAKMPRGLNYGMLWGASLLCGIGFTMSLFIGSLAFEHGDMLQTAAVKLGVIGGSLVSGIAGFLVLKASLRPAETGTPLQQE